MLQILCWFWQGSFYWQMLCSYWSAALIHYKRNSRSEGLINICNADITLSYKATTLVGFRKTASLFSCDDKELGGFWFSKDSLSFLSYLNDQLHNWTVILTTQSTIKIQLFLITWLLNEILICLFQFSASGFFVFLATESMLGVVHVRAWCNYNKTFVFKCNTFVTWYSTCLILRKCFGAPDRGWDQWVEPAIFWWPSVGSILF